jgi:hypothetical protein
MARVRRGRFFTTLRRDYPDGKWTLYITPRAGDSFWFSISFDGRRPVRGEWKPAQPVDNLL